MPVIHTGLVSTIQLATQQKAKRAVSGYIDTDAAAVPTNISAIMYTSTAITVTAINFYVVDQIQGAAFELDVGINGNDDDIVAADGTGITAADSVVAVAVGTAAVAADSVITASTHTADGTGGTIQVAIEYVEVDV